MINNRNWWEPDYGFFGDFYIEGDNSLNGYLEGKKQSLSDRVEVEVTGIIRLLDLKPQDKVLDLPCGYGRHSIGLAKKGYHVTGCDINPTHLEVANKNSKILNVSPSFVLGDMLNYQSDEKFNAIINMFYSFGFFANDHDNFQTLVNFYNNLLPGGRFLFHTDVNLQRVFSGRYREYEERKLSNGGLLKIVDKYDPTSKRMNGSWTITVADKLISKEYSVRVYSQEEFCELCKTAGFINIKIYGDWNAAPCSDDTEDMLVIAEKPR